MEFNKVIQKRESVRKYSDTKPTEDQVKYILEAGRLAPTAFNKQPQRVYILKSGEALQRMDSVHPCRYGAPMVILVCSDKNAASNFQGGNSYLTDGVIAATHMMLAATDIGLDTCWAGVNDVLKTQNVFDLPENIYPICFLDLGIRASDFKGVSSDKKRNPIDSMVTIL